MRGPREVPCPVCVDEGDSPWMEGWVTTLTADGTFPEEAVGTALAQIWRPCTKHAARDVTIYNDGDTWRWAGARWTIMPTFATNH